MRRALIILSLLAAVLLVACGNAAGPGPTGSPKPDPTGSPKPNPTAKPSPTPAVPSDPKVVLDIAGDWDVTALIKDLTGGLRSVKSGVGKATMTVRWFDSKVSNLDGSTLEVVFVGLPRNEDITVEVAKSGGKLVIEVDQASPPLNSDAQGLDRVLVLEFEEPISAADVEVRFKGIAS